MNQKIAYKLHSGKNSKLAYYTANCLRLAMPKWLFRCRLESELSKARLRDDLDEIRRRVDYYCKLSGITPLHPDAPTLAEHHFGEQKVYFFDTYMYTRWFPQSFRWGFCPGDVTFVPDQPSVVKSRPLVDDNANSVVMKLDKVRHFLFVKDRRRFADKRDMVIFRGKVHNKESRRRFMEMYFDHPMCDLGDVGRHSDCPAKWHTAKMTVSAHLDYKFIMALEGNDVASNLKWVMSSNSVAVMPRPTCETWFMEGTLIPNYHYIEIKPDFSDLEERLRHYIDHPSEAEAIIRHAHEHVARFRDNRREKLISLMVLDKYFRMTGQKP